MLALGLIFASLESSVAYEVSPVAGGATVTGKIVFKGAVPEPVKLLITKDQAVCGEGHVERREVHVTQGGALRDVVVSLEKVVKGKKWDKPSTGFMLNQEKCIFDPYLQVVPKLAQLTILNSDPHLHNIHAYELIGKARRTLFNVAQPTQGHKVAKTIKPRRSEVIRVECDAHNWMLGWIYVVDNPYFAVVGADGSFNIAEIPPGEYKLKAWHPFLGTQAKAVKISAKAKVEVNFEFSQ